MVTRDELRGLARDLGFERDVLVEAVPTDAPGNGPIHPQAWMLIDDPHDILPTARSVLVLARPYRPFEENAGEAEVDAYYIESNRAHENAALLAARLREAGICAEMTSSLRVKPWAARAGLGYAGLNTLIAGKDFGSRMCLQTIVTDLEPDAAEADEADDLCAHCGACVRACPTGALRGDGTLDPDKCVRAQAENKPLPENMRALTGASLLGCDFCQQVCPKNVRVSRAPMPMDLREALKLERLLSGDYKALIPYLGKNNARKMRILSRAVLAAAQRGRRDLLPLLEKLTDEAEPVGEHARWAVNELKKNMD